MSRAGAATCGCDVWLQRGCRDAGLHINHKRVVESSPCAGVRVSSALLHAGLHPPHQAMRRSQRDDSTTGLRHMPASVWALGFVSMLMDISSEMIHSVLPMFMVTILGASAFSVGLIEGAAESTALIVKVFSGVLSDFLGKR